MAKRLFFILVFATIAAGGCFAQQGARTIGTNRKKLWDFSYHVWSDGCVTSNYLHVNSSGRHNNNLGDVNSQIDFFNSQVRRLGCIDQAYEQEYFNKANIGDVYYVSYNLSQRNYDPYTGGSYVIYTLAILEVRKVYLK